MVDFLTTKLPQLLTFSATDLKKHPAYSLATRLDWRKAKRWLDGDWPTPWPEPLMLGENKKADEWWWRAAKRAEYVVFDVETVQVKPPPKPEWSKRVFQIGLYAKGKQPAIWDRDKYPELEDTFIQHFKDAVAMVPSVAHNAPFDVDKMRFNFGVPIDAYVELHDTISMHHILWPEFPHNLEFCLSVVSEYPKAKHLGVGDYGYLVGDVVGTGELFEVLLDELSKDRASDKIYQFELQPLAPHIMRTMEHGFIVDADFVEKSLEWLPDHIAHAEAIADAYCGFPISLNSAPKLRIILEEIEDIYDAAKKMAGHSIPKKLTELGETSFDKDSVDALRQVWLAIDADQELTPEVVDERIAQGAHPLLEAKALHGKARVYLASYIKPLLIPLINGDDIGINEQGEWYYEGSLHVGDGSPHDPTEGKF